MSDARNLYLRGEIYTNIDFSILDQKIVWPRERFVIADSVGYITFRCTFDSEWDGLSKRVIFTNGDISKSVLLTSDEPMLIPHEVLTTGKLFVSAVGLGENGEKKITTKKMVLPVVVLEAGAQDGDDPELYSPELWEQALAAVGDLSNLSTIDKSSLVSAINEVAESGIGGGDTSGSSGTNGGYYRPSVDDMGTLSWTASKTGMPAVQSVNIKGPKGDDGEKGEAGTKGQTGATPHLTIGNVTTLAPGSNATANITGTDEEPILNLGIPKGDAGSVSSGASGADGQDGGYYTPSVTDAGVLSWTASKSDMPSVPNVNIRGPQGLKGDTGEIGPQGDTGPAGNDGPQGPIGPSGADGENGGYYTPSVSSAGLLSWTASKSGMPSVSNVNIRGPQGNTGPAGNDGPQGPIGPSGADGENGGYYTPSVSSAGVLSWTASKSGMPSVSNMNITGPQGVAGYSPVRGTDYWTAADIAEIKSYVDDAILNGSW